MLRRLRRIPWDALRTRLILLIIAVGFAFLFPGDTPGGNGLSDKVLGQARDRLFNYVTWEAEALFHKVVQTQSGLAPYLSEADRAAYVVVYLRKVANLQTLNARIDAILKDPTIPDKEAASAEFVRLRDEKRKDVAVRQALAEAIIETQIASVLRDEGLAVLGEVIPPVSAHITDLPLLLIISPREQIRRELAVNLVAMPPEEQARLEDSIDHGLNVSSLIVPLGGLGLYPSMVYQTWSTRLFNTVAHEWSHNYLYFFPLGLLYMNSYETLTINETTASLFGNEIERKVILRFYKDYPALVNQLPPEIPRRGEQKPTPTPTSRDPNAPPRFDYNSEMNTTRITVDFLLHFKLVDLAERYMEARRRVFAANGYNYRKLNQAFFAFYGGYQAPGGGGAGGADPIGPAIADIRANSPSLKAWLETMRNITTREQLLATRNSVRGR